MNSLIRIFLFCPVPENQKPMNEFLSFQENFLNKWIRGSKQKYKKNLLNLYILDFFLNLFLFFPFQNFKGYNSILPFFFLINFYTLIIFFFLFFIFFVRWILLENRFKNARLFYEEGSWYDSQIWEKPFFLIKNDRLLTTQKIQPILQKISKSTIFLFYLVLFLELILSF
jgi:hypothetical protein